MATKDYYRIDEVHPFVRADFGWRDGPHDHLWQSSKGEHGYADGDDLIQLELIALAKDMGVYHDDEGVWGQEWMLHDMAEEAIKPLSPAQRDAVLQSRRAIWSSPAETAPWLTWGQHRTQEILIHRGVAIPATSKSQCRLSPLGVVMRRVLMNRELAKLANEGIRP